MTRSQSDDPSMNPDERCTTPAAPADTGPVSVPTTPTWPPLRALATLADLGRFRFLRDPRGPSPARRRP